MHCLKGKSGLLLQKLQQKTAGGRFGRKPTYTISLQNGYVQDLAASVEKLLLEQLRFCSVENPCAACWAA